MNLLNKPKIKICGIKEIDTLDLCIKNNVHYFGLIFYEKSPRNIRYQDAKKILEYSKNKKIYSVGVFVNEKKEVLTDLLNNLNFNFIQLHGSESNFYINFIKNKNKTFVPKHSYNSFWGLQSFIEKYILDLIRAHNK